MWSEGVAIITVFVTRWSYSTKPACGGRGLPTPKLPTPPTSRRVLAPVPANTNFKTRSVARRPHVRGAWLFFPREDFCKLLFVRILLSLFYWKWNSALHLLFLYSMQQHVTRAWAPKHVLRVENKFREKWEVLVVVWKEIWEKIKNVMIISSYCI